MTYHTFSLCGSETEGVVNDCLTLQTILAMAHRIVHLQLLDGQNAVLQILMAALK